MSLYTAAVTKIVMGLLRTSSQSVTKEGERTMGKRSLAFLVAAALLIIGGLLYVPGTSASNTVVSKAGVTVFRVADITTMGGLTAPDVGDLINGASMKLTRTADGISMVLNTSGLPAGPYSIWWAINNDNNDTTGVDPGSPLVEGVEIIRRATGGIVGANGVGKFEATLPAAPVPVANGVTVMVNEGGSQVLDPLGARIGLVIRNHGPVIPGAVDEQTNLFAGGCANTPTLGLPGAFLGGNTCFDPQATEFHVP